MSDWIEAIKNLVTQQLAFANYDPTVFRRPKLAVVGFEVDFAVEEEERYIVDGPLTLQSEAGEHFNHHLKLIVPIKEGGTVETSEVRAAYVVETDPETGACKETAALANA